MFEIAEIKNESEYNPFAVSKTAPFTEAWFFGEWQKAMGRKVRRFKIKSDKVTDGFFQAIKYPLPLGQSFLYIPHGPVLTRKAPRPDSEFLEKFSKKLKEIGKEENAAFARFDFFPKVDDNDNDFKKYFRKTPVSHYSSSYFQPKYEWQVDLTGDEKDLLGGMRQKTRYNIGLAVKKGIHSEISENFVAGFEDFFNLLAKTAKRDNFNLHPKSYYENIFKTLDANNAFLSVASYEGKILAINLILLFGNMAYFIYGGSSDEFKNLMAPHLAHWGGIKEAKKRGFKFYNFGAVDPSNSLRVNNFEGISHFKKGFGGRVLEYSDSYDLVFKPFWYLLYNLRKIYMRF